MNIITNETQIMRWVEIKALPNYDQIIRVHEAFKERINQYSDLRLAEAVRINERLEEFCEEDLYEAINRFSNDGWWMHNNSFRCAGWFFKSKQRINRFLRIKTTEEYWRERGYEWI